MLTECCETNESFRETATFHERCGRYPRFSSLAIMGVVVAHQESSGGSYVSSGGLQGSSGGS
jgi:hypothetical protein